MFVSFMFLVKTKALKVYEMFCFVRCELFFLSNMSMRVVVVKTKRTSIPLFIITIFSLFIL